MWVIVGVFWDNGDEGHLYRIGWAPDQAGILPVIHAYERKEREDWEDDPLPHNYTLEINEHVWEGVVVGDPEVDGRIFAFVFWLDVGLSLGESDAEVRAGVRSAFERKRIAARKKP